MIRKLSKSKSKKIPPRVPEGEAIIDMPELSMEELNEEFKKRMREYRNFVKFILYDLNVKDNSKVLEIFLDLLGLNIFFSFCPECFQITHGQLPPYFVNTTLVSSFSSSSI